MAEAGLSPTIPRPPETGESAGRVVLMDADMSRDGMVHKMLSLCCDLKEESVTLHRFQRSPAARNFVLMNAKAGTTLTAVFRGKLMALLSAGKRVFVACGSAREVRALRDSNVFAEFGGLFYCQESTLEERNVDVNVVWKKQLVVTTTVFTVGSSFDKEWFDCAMLFGFPNGPCLRELLQTLMRVRKLADEGAPVYVCISGFGGGDSRTYVPPTYESTLADMKTQRPGTLNHWTDGKPSVLTQLKAYDRCEAVRSKDWFLQELVEQCWARGWTVQSIAVGPEEERLDELRRGCRLLDEHSWDEAHKAFLTLNGPLAAHKAVLAGKATVLQQRVVLIWEVARYFRPSGPTIPPIEWTWSLFQKMTARDNHGLWQCLLVKTLLAPDDEELPHPKDQVPIEPCAKLLQETATELGLTGPLDTATELTEESVNPAALSLLKQTWEKLDLRERDGRSKRFPGTKRDVKLMTVVRAVWKAGLGVTLQSRKGKSKIRLGAMRALAEQRRWDDIPGMPVKATKLQVFEQEETEGPRGD